ncbi:MAG TPA: phage baseplate assembly protein V [Polyangiaceae bacterium]
MTEAIRELSHAFDELVRGRFYGKYEGVVTHVDDPLELGRLRAHVPAVFGEDVESGWALPCMPFGGGKNRGFLAVPEVGDSIWIEFAGGDPSRPIWSGVFWGSPESSGQPDDLGEATGSEVPTSNNAKAGPKRVVLRTKAGHLLCWDDENEVIIIAHGDGKSEVRINKSGDIVVTAESIKLGKDASERLVLGDKFMQLFNTHTHPTGVGPSGPSKDQMSDSHLSSLSKTK